MNNKYYLRVSKDATTEIYSLPGTIPNPSSDTDPSGSTEQTSSRKIETQSVSKPYPNPARGSISLPYKLRASRALLHVLDMSGKMVGSYVVNGDATSFQLDVSTLPAGQYLYQVEGVSQTFIVEQTVASVAFGKSGPKGRLSTLIYPVSS